MNETNNLTPELKSGMPNTIIEMNTETATIVTLISLILMAILSIVGLMGLFDLLVFGNENLTRSNIDADQGTFYLGLYLYYIVLVFDIIVSWTFYLVYRNINRSTAKLIGSSRFLYSIINLVAVTILAMLRTDLYQYVTLIAFGFFIVHLFLLGYGSLQSEILHNLVGIWLIIGSLSYIILEYGEFLLSGTFYNVLTNIALIPASLTELTLAIYLVVVRNKIKEDLIQNNN